MPVPGISGAGFLLPGIVSELDTIIFSSDALPAAPRRAVPCRAAAFRAIQIHLLGQDITDIRTGTNALNIV